MKRRIHRNTYSGAVVLAGMLGSSSIAAAPLTGNHTVHVAFAHDYVLRNESDRAHLLPSVAARFDSDGALRSFADAGSIAWLDQPVGHFGNDGVIAWGRWGRGRIQGSGRHGGFDITGGEGVRNALYYVAGVPARGGRSGVATYAFLGGGVAPTAGEGAFAAATELRQGELRADFSRRRADLDLTIWVPSGLYVLTARNLALQDGIISVRPASEVKVDGVFCFSGCRAYLHGFVAGRDGQRAGIAFNIDVEALSEDANGAVAWTIKDSAQSP